MKPNGSSKALVVVTDGLGYDADTALNVLATLKDSFESSVLGRVKRAISDSFDFDIDEEDALNLVLMPRVAEGISPSISWVEANRRITAANHAQAGLARYGIWREISSRRTSTARKHRYIPWIADSESWNRIVNSNLAVPTFASGIWVGYEDVDPPVQGNSETGHQQIGNLGLAPQIPLEITRSIDSGAFYTNVQLGSALENALINGNNINFCFLLSGVRGSDGRVHSAWNHLEAFCEFVFSRLGASPDRVRMQAILDGRDAPARGSLSLEGLEGGYLDHLERLLSRYEALDSLAWVIGRSIAMDRDYREENARTDYLQLTKAEGVKAEGFDELRHIVADSHASGLTDADVPPIVMAAPGRRLPVIEPGDAFINLNFRSDRQRAKTASLCGAKSYLAQEGLARGRNWKLDWMRKDLNLDICTIAEYDAVFEAEYGVKVAFSISPHKLNFLSHWQRLFPDEARYLLVAESVKSSHMGYFLRGRREQPAAESVEDRLIIPSTGQNEGVSSDSDFYLHPAMRTREVGHCVAEAMEAGEHRLIMCNFAAPDMVGHLLPTRFEESVVAYDSTISTLLELADTASRCGYSMIVTSDHGNIENDAPTHTINPVLTTIIPASGKALRAVSKGKYCAKLFDISPTVARLLGVDGDELARIVEENRDGLESSFIGRSIV